MSKNFLSDLISALATSVVEAQQKMEQAQYLNFLSYFKNKQGVKNLYPRTLKMALPSLRPNAAGNLDQYRIPIVSMLPQNMLRIDKTEMNFAISLNGIGKDVAGDKNVRLYRTSDRSRSGPPNGAEDVPEDQTESAAPLMIDLNGNWGKNKGLKADIKLVVSNTDTPEGILRMIDEVGKSCQGYRYDKSPQSVPPPEITKAKSGTDDSATDETGPGPS